MSVPRAKILVTAASGQLGQRVIDRLTELLAPREIAAMVRTPEAAARLAQRGIDARVGDYTRPATLDAAFAGTERILLISSNAIGVRIDQHRNAIEAAKRAGAGVAYTSLLHAATSRLGLAAEHVETERLLQTSGVPHVILRNGWYTENFTAGLPAILAMKTVFGSAGDGRISAAARVDYAAAAAAVLVAPEPFARRIYELAGDAAFTLADFAAEIARQTGQAIAYHNLPKAERKAGLLAAGLPADVAELIADSEAGAAGGALYDASHALRALIGRPTTPLSASLTAALA